MTACLTDWKCAYVTVWLCVYLVCDWGFACDCELCDSAVVTGCLDVLGSLWGCVCDCVLCVLLGFVCDFKVLWECCCDTVVVTTCFFDLVLGSFFFFFCLICVTVGTVSVPLSWLCKESKSTAVKGWFWPCVFLIQGCLDVLEWLCACCVYYWILFKIKGGLRM